MPDFSIPISVSGLVDNLKGQATQAQSFISSNATSLQTAASGSLADISNVSTQLQGKLNGLTTAFGSDLTGIPAGLVTSLTGMESHFREVILPSLDPLKGGPSANQAQLQNSATVLVEQANQTIPVIEALLTDSTLELKNITLTISGYYKDLNKYIIDPAQDVPCFADYVSNLKYDNLLTDAVKGEKQAAVYSVGATADTIHTVTAIQREFDMRVSVKRSYFSDSETDLNDNIGTIAAMYGEYTSFIKGFSPAQAPTA